MIVILDTGLIGLVTNPNSNEKSVECLEWLYGLLAKGVRVISSDICDYEVRRGLVLDRKISNSGGSGIHRLDEFRKVIDFLPINSEILIEACDIWAEFRIKSQLNASERDINFDIILSAQWKILKDQYPGREVIIATDNLRDFIRFSTADLWQNIRF